MINRLIQADNLSFVGLITRNVALFGSLILILFAAIIFLVQRLLNIYLFFKSSAVREGKMAFYGYKLLISAGIIVILPLLISIINLGYTYTLGALITLTLGSIGAEKLILINVFSRLLRAGSILIILVMSIWPFYGWRKLLKIGYLYVILVFIVMFLSHIVIRFV